MYIVTKVNSLPILKFVTVVEKAPTHVSRLSMLAKEYLRIHASSVPSMMVFNLARNLDPKSNQNLLIHSFFFSNEHGLVFE